MNALQLQNSDFSPSTVIQIPAPTCMHGSSNSELVVMLTAAEWRVVQGAANLGTTTGNTFVSLGSGFVTDVNQVPIAPVAIQVSPSRFVPNNEPPHLVDGSVDLNSRSLNLEFSEGVNANSISLSGVSVNFTTTSGLRMSLILSGGQAVTGDMINHALVMINLDLADFNAFRQAETDPLDFVISIEPNSITDHNNVFNEFQENIPISQFLIDTTPPSLISFTINLDNAFLDLTFSEDVNLASIIVGSLTLTNAGGGEQQALSGTKMGESTGLSSTITIVIFDDSLNFAKFLSQPRLAINANGVVDASENFVQAIDLSSALEATSIIPDQTSPQLLSFTPSFRSSGGEIALNFSEFVDTSSWNGEKLVLLLETFNGDVERRGFTSGTFAPGVSNIVIYTFSNTEYDITSFPDAFMNYAINLTAEAGLISDVGGNPLQNAGPIRWTQRPDDTVPPTINSCDLNMETGGITIAFSEPVNILSLSRQILFLSDQSGTHSVTIDDATQADVTLKGPKPFWTLSIGADGLTALKANAELCTTDGDCFIMGLPDLARDRSGNQIIENAGAIQVLRYTPDSSPPELTGFEFNLDRGELKIRFSEPILRSSLDFALISLASPDASMAITETTNVSWDDFERLVSITVTTAILNNIKFASICLSMSTCSLNYQADSFSDMAGNAVATTDSVPSNIYYEDTISPALVSYTIDLNMGSVVLSFSEPISNFNSSAITIGITSDGLTQSINLIRATETSRESLNRDIHLSLSQNTLNQLKSLNSMALNSMASISLSIESSDAITDTSSVNVDPIDNLSPSNDFAADTTSPELVQFIPSIRSDNTEFTFVFDEFVIAHRAGSEGLFFQLKTQNHNLRYTDLSIASLTPGPTDRITLTFADPEFIGSSFLSIYSESVDEGSLCFNLPSSFISDLAGNSYSGELLIHTNIGDTTCDVSCATNMFSTNAGCQPCHQQCADSCTGPANTDCAVCLEETRDIPSGGVECVPFCAVGTEYSASTEACQLTL